MSLFKTSCGNDTVSQDLNDTLSYRCTDDDIKETFSIRTFRFFGADEGDAVYFHCEFRVCLQSALPTLCDCPSSVECDTNTRKRRSVNDVIVDESQLYYVTSGPFIFKNYQDKDEEANEEEGMEMLLLLNKLLIIAKNWLLIQIHQSRLPPGSC